MSSTMGCLPECITSSDIVTLFVICLLWIFSLFCICWLWSFNILKGREEIVPRRPVSSNRLAVTAIFGLAIHLPITLALLNLSFKPDFPYAPRLTDILSAIGQSAPLHIMTYRAYMIYFDIKWNLAMQDKEWRLHIDPHEKNWFLYHRNTFGNSRLVSFIIFCHWLLWLIAIVIAGLADDGGRGTKYSRPMLGGYSIVTIICDFIIFLKFPKFNDVFGIRNEIKLTLGMLITAVLGFYTAFVLFNENEYVYALALLFIGIVFFGLTMVTLFYPLHKFKYPKTPCKAKAFMIREISHREFSEHNAIQDEREERIGVIFKKLMISSNGFNAFARHLMKEFCVENLLFFIETQQWILHLKRLSVYRDMESSELISVELHGTCPKSNILGIHNEDNSHNLSLKKRKSIKGVAESMIEAVRSPKATYSMTISLSDLDPNSPPARTPSKDEEDESVSMEECIQCSKLYRKFVHTDAYFCINVRHSVRRELNKLFGTVGRKSMVSSISTGSHVDEEEIEELAQHLYNSNISKEQFFHIFDAARESIYRLLLQSVGRFKNTDDYKKLQLV